MLSFGISVSGLTGAQLGRAAATLRPEYLKIMRRIMYRGRGRMAKLAAGAVLHARAAGVPSGKRRGRASTVTLLKRAKVSVGITAAGVVGRLTHRARLLNIHEGGAQVPAATMNLKQYKLGKRSAFHFDPSTKGAGFARGTIRRGAFRLPARPIAGPVLRELVALAQEQFPAKAVDIIEGFKR